MSVVREIKDENNPAKIGLIVSSIVIAGSLIPKISSSWINVSDEHSLFIFTIGLFLLMLFMGIRVNMNFRFEKVGNSICEIDTLPNNDYTTLSKSFFWLAALFLIISIILLFLGF